MYWVDPEGYLNRLAVGEDISPEDSGFVVSEEDLRSADFSRKTDDGAVEVTRGDDGQYAVVVMQIAHDTGCLGHGFCYCEPSPVEKVYTSLEDWLRASA